MGREQWKPVVGFDGYEVSSHGGVRSFRVSAEGRYLRPGHSRAGERGGEKRPPNCLVVALRRDGKTVTRKVHSLVMEAFVGPLPEGLEVRHLDGDYTNNHLGNLRYGTRSENSFDALRHGTHVALVRGA